MNRINAVIILAASADTWGLQNPLQYKPIMHPLEPNKFDDRAAAQAKRDRKNAKRLHDRQCQILIK